ncbi:MAG: cellulase family glycosylhydrolase [Bryobacterales bacterium]|nr:cellulase family glycosylhydrolase [Bryobacterales bacterium]
MGRILWTALLAAALAPCQVARWDAAKAKAWYAAQPWLVGGNYTPASAINQLEMWQADTFDAKRIDLELGWAAGIGMNTMRVFLHDLLWQQDAAGFRKRIDTFLSIAGKHGIRPMFVLFDSVWDPAPQLGKQRAPKPGVHNSGWVQGPGAKALSDPAQEARLESYVKGVVGAFANDRRVLAWDVWNEPDNMNGSSYRKLEPENKIAMVNALLPKVFVWARVAKASQPLTSGVWQGEWGSDDKLSATDRILLEQSDVISFHDYNDGAMFERRVKALLRFGRPVLCTEYMARGNRSTFQGSLPIGLQYGVAMYNWGLVEGKTQTHLPWDSWKQPYINGREPAVWFHEVFRIDGKPYRQEEVQLIKKLISESKARKVAR